MTSYCHTCGKPTTKDNLGNLQVICEHCHRQFKDDNEDYLAQRHPTNYHICGVLQ